jgi:hypothetical protein
MVYYFMFEAEPAKGNRYYGRTRYGEASVLVSGDRFGDDPDALLAAAEAYVTAEAWVPKNLVKACCTNPPAPGWRKELAALYQEALLSGVSGYFVASPDSDVPGGPTILARPH